MKLDPVPEPGKEWAGNHGTQPGRTKGKRIEVVLANGSRPSPDPVTPVSPGGWAADTCRWTLTDDPFDIAWFKIIGTKA